MKHVKLFESWMEDENKLSYPAGAPDRSIEMIKTAIAVIGEGADVTILHDEEGRNLAKQIYDAHQGSDYHEVKIRDLTGSGRNKFFLIVDVDNGVLGKFVDELEMRNFLEENPDAYVLNADGSENEGENTAKYVLPVVEAPYFAYAQSWGQGIGDNAIEHFSEYLKGE